MRTGRWAMLMVMGAVLAACGSSDSAPTIDDARLGAPTGPNAALYFTAEGYGTDDSLVGARTEVSRNVAVHETVMDTDGTMSMQHVSELHLGASDQLVLEPGGYHLMLIDVEDLAVGSSIEVTLDWELAGTQVIVATVVDPSDTMGDMG